MFPTLFDSRWIGLDGSLHFTISTYFTALMMGYLLGTWISWREAKTWGMDRQVFTDFAIWMLIIGILGSRVMHVFVDGFLFDYIKLCSDPLALDGRALKSLQACTANMQCLAEQQAGQDIGAVCNPTDGLCYPQRDCLRWAKFWAGGLTVYGSLIACVTFAVFYLKRHNIRMDRIMDLGGVAIFLGIGLGRLGCLGAGCCYGQLCDPSVGIHFPVGSVAYNHHLESHYTMLATQWQSGLKASLAVYPTQWISSAYNLAIFAIAYFVVRPRKRFHGQVLLTSAILYGICRFLIEFIRDDFRGEYFGLSTSQAVSVPILLGAIYLLWRKWSQAKKQTDAAPSTDA